MWLPATDLSGIGTQCALRGCMRHGAPGDHTMTTSCLAIRTVSRLPAILAALCLAGTANTALAFEPGKGKQPVSISREIDLRPRFHVGHDIRFTLELSDKEIALKPAGAPAPKDRKPPKGAPTDRSAEVPKENVFRQDVGIRLKPESTDGDGNTTLELSLESFKMVADGPMGKVEFDSTKPPAANDPMDALFRSITTTKMGVVIDRSGEVKGITPRGDGGGVAALISGNITGGDFVRSLVGDIFSPRAGRTSASVGETWTEESTMKSGAGNWTLVIAKNLSRYSGGNATIDMKGHVKIDPASIGGGPTGANAKTETVYTGQAVWDVEGGMLERFDATMLSDVGLVGGLGALSGGLGDLTGGAGGVSEDGTASKPARHETIVKVRRVR